VVQVASVEAGDPFLTEIRFFLDGSVAGSAPFLVEVRPPSTCLASVPPNCGGSCPSIVIDGDTVAGICVLYEEDCYCIYLQSFNVSPVPMQEGAQLTGIVDPDNVVEETDENNNMFSGPVAAAITTWGTMKALYQ
jgi:hypothetical protein